MILNFFSKKFVIFIVLSAVIYVGDSEKSFLNVSPLNCLPEIKTQLMIIGKIHIYKAVNKNDQLKIPSTAKSNCADSCALKARTVVNLLNKILTGFIETNAEFFGDKQNKNQNSIINVKILPKISDQLVKNQEKSWMCECRTISFKVYASERVKSILDKIVKEILTLKKNPNFNGFVKNVCKNPKLKHCIVEFGDDGKGRLLTDLHVRQRRSHNNNNDLQVSNHRRRRGATVRELNEFNEQELERTQRTGFIYCILGIALWLILDNVTYDPIFIVTHSVYQFYTVAVWVEAFRVLRLLRERRRRRQ